MCVRVFLYNWLPLRDSPITAVTKRIVRIFDVIADREREKDRTSLEPQPKGRNQDFFFHVSSIQCLYLPPSFSISHPSCSWIPLLLIQLSTPMCLFRGFAARVSYQSSPGLRLGCGRSYCQPHSLLSAPWQSQWSGHAYLRNAHVQWYSWKKKKGARAHIGAKQKGGSD